MRAPRTPPLLLAAKLRARRRRTGSGAAMFVVAMTLTVLASVGVYALAAASNEVRTSGNERQNTQTHYLSEYGVIGTNHEIIASKAQFYLGLMMRTPDTSCVSLPGVPSSAAPITRACRRLGSSELGQAWTQQNAQIFVPYGGTVPYQASQGPGSLGPTPMNPDFFVELTDPNKAADAKRYAKDLSFCFIRVTATSTGITQPLIPGQPTAVYANEGVEVQRARIVAGPIQCPR